MQNSLGRICSNTERAVILLLVSYWLLGEWPALGAGEEYVYSVLGLVIGGFLPGFLILRILEYDVAFPKYTLYSVSLSLIWMMGLGVVLSIASQQFGLIPPLLTRSRFTAIFILSTLPLLIATRTSSSTYPKISASGRPGYVLSAFTLPVIAVTGALILNSHGTNIIIIFFLTFLSIFVLIAATNDKLANSLSIWSVSFALLLQNSVIDTNLKQGDAMREYIVAQQVLQAGTWNPQAPFGTSQMLRLSILHPGFKLLMDIPLF